MFNKDIENYLKDFTNKNYTYITDGSLDFNGTKSIYININLCDCSNIDKILSSIYFSIENGGIIHFQNWFNNITNEKSLYCQVTKWKNNLKYKDLIEFPVSQYNEKIFIMLENNESGYWSE